MDICAKVASVEKTKRGGRLKVTLEDGRVFRLSPGASIAGEIFEGGELSPEMQSELLKHGGLRADEAAAGSLGRRPMSVAEVSKRLDEKGYSEDEIAAAVEKLTAIGFLDDREYAALVAQDARAKNRSRRALLAELSRRGIDRELAAEIAEGCGPDTEQIIALVLSKYGDGYERTAQMRGKIQGWLLRRGFGYSDIREALYKIERGLDE